MAIILKASAKIGQRELNSNFLSEKVGMTRVFCYICTVIIVPSL